MRSWATFQPWKRRLCVELNFFPNGVTLLSAGEWVSVLLGKGLILYTCLISGQYDQGLHHLSSMTDGHDHEYSLSLPTITFTLTSVILDMN